jgi:hypothetical protein
MLSKQNNELNNQQRTGVCVKHRTLNNHHRHYCKTQLPTTGCAYTKRFSAVCNAYEARMCLLNGVSRGLLQVAQTMLQQHTKLSSYILHNSLAVLSFAATVYTLGHWQRKYDYTKLASRSCGELTSKMQFLDNVTVRYWVRGPRFFFFNTYSGRVVVGRPFPRKNWADLKRTEREKEHNKIHPMIFKWFNARSILKRKDRIKSYIQGRKFWQRKNKNGALQREGSFGDIKWVLSHLLVKQRYCNVSKLLLCSISTFISINTCSADWQLMSNYTSQCVLLKLKKLVKLNQCSL